MPTACNGKRRAPPRPEWPNLGSWGGLSVGFWHVERPGRGLGEAGGPPQLGLTPPEGAPYGPHLCSIETHAAARSGQRQAVRAAAAQVAQPGLVRLPKRGLMGVGPGCGGAPQ